MLRTLTLDAAVDGPADLGERTRAMEDLFNAHHRRLYALARRLVGEPEEARDLVQEAFLRLARRPGTLPRDSAGEGFLVRTVVNLCRDRWRRRKVRLDALPSLVPERPRRSGSEDAALARAMVWSALAHLPPRRRAVVVLHEIEGRGVDEVARLLGVAQVTIRWQLLMARRSLRRLLEGAGPSPERR